ncbi:23S rRNA (uracil(1939)-C(5))-methyltransferase RlmD [Candidatus Peregrinibacteria bacterium CG10_big_fil_rev_8_21_14_0_10_36_19]|nr:MAG: 23S rRNA (uracil(1939)-C(5))-methyltransferase RlmD [Candidatus Peregrinibacteria bacterium CG10_big_fil_rev_8_21_14_0_10_36_19]
MNIRKGDIVEFKVESIAFGGRGVGKYDGKTIFVDGVMPGDKVKVSLSKIKHKFFDSDLVEVVEESEQRVKSKCKYFGKCGGCQLQFMKYEDQLKLKKRFVSDSFERIGGLKNVNILDVVAGEEEYFYRNKMEFSFGYDEDFNFTLGFHVPGRKYDILDIDECHLQSYEAVEILNATRDFMKKLKWPPFKYSDGTGFLKHLTIREGKRTNEIMVCLVTSAKLPDNAKMEIEKYAELLKSFDFGEKKITSIYWLRKIAERGKPTRIEQDLLFGNKVLNEKMILENGDELKFEILPQAFFQVNTFQAEALYSEVINLASESNGVAFDLFCGTGTIGLFLAKHLEQVFGIEMNESAVKSAKENAKNNNVFNIDFYVGDVAKLVKSIPEKPNLVVVDPPRAGLTQDTISHLNEFSPEKIIYVSCNPATLARDCALLSEYGYKIKSVKPFDLFPQTYHIENVCLLER